MNDKIIISICGAGGAGKSSLAKKVVHTLGTDISARVPTDYYLKSYSGEPFEEFISTPFRYDWELLKKVFQIPIGIITETPDYDFVKLTRLDKTGGKPFTVSRYMVIDSILPYPESNFIFRIEAPADLRLKNIKERDKAQKTNSARNWEKMELTASELNSRKYKYDLVLNGFNELDENAEKIFEYLRRKGVVD
ncbi:MAG: hypothetical protein K8I03_06150 [Ignavibacteria bacterium]|nr:hypothetical protein [Ignavibacteria bacterium]